LARLLEHEAKRLLAAAGIPTPPGRVATSPEDASAIAAELGGAVAIKAQIRIGKRGKAGAIKFADDAAGAAAAAGGMIGASVYGHRVAQVLVERKLEILDEYYLGVFSNPATRMPTLIFSRHGGVDVEEQATRGKEGFSTLDIDLAEPFRLYMALEFLRLAGIGGAALAPLAQMAVRLFELYRKNDCTIAEINPVAMTRRGPVAADARIDVDDDALFRHPELGIAAGQAVGDRPPTPLEAIAAQIDDGDHRGSAHFVQIDPDGSLAASEGMVSIGFDGVGTGVSLTTMDELVALGFRPKNFCDTSGNPTASKLYRITRVILAQPDIEGYVFVSCLSSQQLDNTARGIVKAFLELWAATGGQPNIPCVLCFRGAWDETALEMFERHGITKSPLVRLLGRDATERDVAIAFRELHAIWRDGRAMRARA
jgi:succinyl-CoA synthetase beta subunit